MSVSNTAVQKNSPKAKTLPAPKGWVRWSGLGILMALILSVVGISYLGMSYGLKKQIEHYASQAWGAEVNIGSLQFGLFPLSVAVNQIALTNPKVPEQNQLQIKQLQASLNVYHLVVGRTVIEDLTFSGFAMHQPRKTPGQVYHKAPEKTEAPSQSSEAMNFSLPKMDLPDPQTILQRETLETLSEAQKIQAELTKIDQAWSKLQANLPSDEVIKVYQQRFEALSKGDFRNPAVLLQKQKEFETLKKEVEAKQAILEEGKSLLGNLKTLKADAQALSALPQKDYERLMTKYNLSEQGVLNVTSLLFGPKIQTWMNTAQEWYGKLQPVIAQVQAWRAETAAEAEVEKAKRAFGTLVTFKEFDPQPEFMIKRIHGDGDIDWGHVTLAIKQLNFDQENSKKPVTFVIEALPVAQVSPLKIVGESNYVQPSNPMNRANFSLADYRLSEAILSGDKTLPVVMKQGALNLTGQMALVAGNQIKGQFDAGFKGVSLDASASESAEVKKYIAPIFADIQQFKVHSAISGDALAPKLDARSDLDKLLSSAFSKALDRELANAKLEVKKQLDLLLAEQLEPIHEKLSGLLGNESVLSGQSLDLDAILKGKLPVADQKALEQKASQEAEKALKKEAEKALGDKAKNLLKGFGF